MIGTRIAPNVIGHLLSKLFHSTGTETGGLCDSSDVSHILVGCKITHVFIVGRSDK